MCRNDLKLLKVGPGGVISLLNGVENTDLRSDSPPEQFMAVLMVFQSKDFSRVVIWLPGDFPADNLELLIEKIEALNRRPGAAVDMYLRRNNGTEQVFLVCPEFRCYCGMFARQCQCIISQHPLIAGCSLETDVDMDDFQRTFDISIQAAA